MFLDETYIVTVRQILGDTVTKGSVYVLFDEGSKSKWVRHLVTGRMERDKSTSYTSKKHEKATTQEPMTHHDCKHAWCKHISYPWQFCFCSHTAQRMYTSM